ncbi:MAG: phosphoglucosamine mutase [Candidatus Micrarchaeia archaeon]
MLFGTNGVRGKFDELNPLLALKIAQGIGIYFKKGKIGVARDGRLTGECLENAVISGLLSVGCRVINFGIISSPTAEFMIKKLSLDGLIIITASHNPPEWNALKVVDEKGISVSKERGEIIEKIMEKIDLAKWDNTGSVQKYENAACNHIEKIMEKIDIKKILEKKPKLVLDFGNGTSATMKTLFEKIGCEIICINEKIDGNFPNRTSEPTKEQVKELINEVKKENADCGIAWDGDGDRVIFIDEQGEYIIGDRVFGISVLIKLKEGAGDIVTTVATSRLIEDIGKKFGVSTEYCKVGAPYLSEKMATGKYCIGGEEVGGVIWPEISLAKDGFCTAVKIIEKMCDKKLSGILKEMPYYFQKKTKIEIEEKKKDFILETARKNAKKEGLKIMDMDGVRINFEDGWSIVRASGTEPAMRIFAEGKTREISEKIMEKTKELAFGL